MDMNLRTICPCLAAALLAACAPRTPDVTTEPFGTLSTGEPVTLYRLSNGTGSSMEVIDYGCRVVRICVPDRNGRIDDVVVGYGDITSFETGSERFFGALIGRYGNRIGGASFPLDGDTVRLTANECLAGCPGHLHGGTKGFDRVMWQGEPLLEADRAGVRFSRLSPDGEEGYPGTLTLSVRFCWKGDSFCIHYHAETDQDTILNLTNHSYFNLNGKGDVQKQLLKIHADLFTPNDDVCLPTGEIRPVAGTAMDFRRFKAIGQDADNDEDCVRASRGYDANFILDGSIPAVTARSPESGIVMQVTTDQPGVQLYTANGMGPVSGKNGQVYGHRAAFCLETQHYPDCIHHPDWPSCILRAGEAFDSTTVYAFSVDE